MPAVPTVDSVPPCDLTVPTLVREYGRLRSVLYVADPAWPMTKPLADRLDVVVRELQVRDILD